MLNKIISFIVVAMMFSAIYFASIYPSVKFLQATE